MAIVTSKMKTEAAKWVFRFTATSLIFFFLTAGLYVKVQDDRRRDVCESVEDLRSTMRTILKRSDMSIDSNPYFKERPELLEKAHAQNRYYLKLVSEEQCQ